MASCSGRTEAVQVREVPAPGHHACLRSRSSARMTGTGTSPVRPYQPALCARRPSRSHSTGASQASRCRRGVRGDAPDRGPVGPPGPALRSLRSDERVLAVLLGGSLATGEGDEESDIDLTVVVDDEGQHRSRPALEAWLRGIGHPVVVAPRPVPGLVTSLMRDGVRLDVTNEPRSVAATAPRSGRDTAELSRPRVLGAAERRRNGGGGRSGRCLGAG